MGACSHVFADDDKRCGQPTSGDARLCLWHNPEVDKRTPYVARLLARWLADHDGHAREFHLGGLCWPRARLDACDLRGADLRDAVLPAARLRGADLRGACLRRASLQGADLRDADLTGADLTGTHLRDANLSRTRLCNGRLDDTVLLGADLRKADLTGAEVLGFRWNRLTRFADAVGLDDDDAALEPTGTPGPGFTPPHTDLSSSVRRSIVGGHHELEDTRFFAVDRGETHRLEGAENVTVAMSNDEGRAIASRARAERSRPGSGIYWLTTSCLLLVWALAATAIAASVLFQRPPELQPGEDPPVADRQDMEEVRQRIRIYKRQITDLEQDLETKRTEIRRQTKAYEQAEDRWNRQRYELDRLQGVDDENDNLRVALSGVRSRLERQIAANRRLRETANIIAEQTDELRLRNLQLEEQHQVELLELNENAELHEQVAELEKRLEAGKEALAETLDKNRELADGLARTERHLQRFLTRIEGTQLEALVNQEEEQGGRLVEITPGRTITLGGPVLISLRVDRVPDRAAFRLRLALQPARSDDITEIGIVFYDRAQRALRRVSYSFPDLVGGAPLAEAVTEISASEFPTTARINIAAGLDLGTAAAGH